MPEKQKEIFKRLAAGLFPVMRVISEGGWRELVVSTFFPSLLSFVNNIIGADKGNIEGICDDEGMI